MGTFSDLTVALDDVIDEDWGNGVRNRVMHIYANATARDAEIVSPAAGMHAYLQDDRTIWAHNGTAWAPIAGPTPVAKSADETINNSAVLQNDDHLVIPVAASATYRGELTLAFTANASSGLQIDFTAPASSTMEASSFLTTVSASLVFSMTNALGAVTGITGTGSKLPVHLWFTLITSATSGNLQLRWAQSPAHASNLTVHKGTSLQLWRTA